MLPSAHHLALEDLGWASFQDLAIAYAEDLLEMPVITYAKVWDGGVDGESTMFTVDPATAGRKWAIQAKHTSRTASITEAMLEAELAKLPALVDQDFDAYLLVTNFSVTRLTASAIRRRVLAAGFKECQVHGRPMLVQRIRSSSKLRVLAPRVYGIGDLSLILDDRRAEQTAALLEASRQDLDRFVATDPYRVAVRALNTDGIVVLLGEPAAGKSTIARVLSVAADDCFGADPYVLHRLDDLSWHWNPSGRPRLFWVDDVFGSTQAEYGSAQTLNRRLPDLAAALDRGNKFVFTSRTYIWRAVAPQLKLSSHPRFTRGIVEVKVEDFSERDRALILANHVRLGDHPPDWRKKFISFAPAVARHPRFTPEVARRIGLVAFTGNLDLSAHALAAYVANPSSYLEELIGGLSPAGQAAMALLFMNGGELKVALPRGDDVAVVTEAFAVTAAQISGELEALEGALCQRQVEKEQPVWRFRHPSIGEAFATLAARSAVLLDVYLRGAPPERLLDELVCAGIKVKGAIVEIGLSHYDQLITRMKAHHYWGRRDGLRTWFLIYRASAEFRRRYFDRPLSADSALLGDGRRMDPATLCLMALLLPDDLVDPDYLHYMRGRLRRGLLEWGVPAALSTEAREVLGHEEFDELLPSVVADLRDGGSSYMEYWEPDRSSEDSPREAFKGLIDFAEKLSWFIDEDEASEILSIVKERVRDRVGELEEQAQREDWDRREEDYYYAQRAAAAPPRSAPASAPRPSIFDPPPADPIADVFSDLDD